MVQSYSQLPFGTGDYNDGEIHPLLVGSTLWQALVNELWLNWSLSQQDMWKWRLQQPLKFVGTVLSHTRQQIEITMVYQDNTGISSGMDTVTVTLANFSRFCKP